MMEKTPIKVENIVYAYGKENVIKDVSIDIEEGFVSIIGPNGSGKTTMLKIISGLIDDCKEGQIQFYGENLKDISPNNRAKTFAIVNQKQTFPFPFTCLEMVALGRFPYRKNMSKMDEDELDIVVKAMEATSTIDFRNKVITEISGGEQQRVILASALAQSTNILFLDEAFSALDISHKAKSIKILKEMTESKKLIVVSVMHDLNIAYKYSDKVCIMKEGEILAFGNPDEVMTVERISSVFDVKIDLVKDKGFFINV